MEQSKLQEWEAELYVELYELSETGKISLTENYFVGKTDINDPNLHPDFIDLYKDSNGMEFYWATDNSNEIGGRIHFLNYETAFLTVNKYDDWQIEQEETLPYFRAIDLITDEAECGIIYNGKEYLSDTMFYLERGDSNLPCLDINFDGYLELLKMSRGYYYWPKVLLDIQSGEESPETNSFKQNMPLIFEDFSWDNFVAKYQALRLSTKA